jgi:hypothetical protein
MVFSGLVQKCKVLKNFVFYASFALLFLEKIKIGKDRKNSSFGLVKRTLTMVHFTESILKRE